MSRTDEELRATLDRLSKERATMKPGEYPEEQPTPPMTKTQELEAERDSLQVQLHLKSGILELELDARRKAEAERDATERERVRLWNEVRELKSSLMIETAATDTMRAERDALRDAAKEALHFITNIDNAHPVVRSLRKALEATE